MVTAIKAAVIPRRIGGGENKRDGDKAWRIGDFSPIARTSMRMNSPLRLMRLPLSSAVGT